MHVLAVNVNYSECFIILWTFFYPQPAGEGVMEPTRDSPLIVSAFLLSLLSLSPFDSLLRPEQDSVWLLNK